MVNEIRQKIKVVPVNAIKVNGEENVQLHSFLTSALDKRLKSASRPGRFNPGPRAPTTRFTGSWLSPRTDMYDI
jgi:hypothetical protein